MTGITFVDFESVCRGNDTYRRLWYCAYEDRELESEHGANTISGAMVLILRCLCNMAAAAMVIARMRLEKTQNVADGNLPVLYSTVMTFSCK
mmetsp:Transcript_59404/g.133882  ORF Transcript_59404/g.133882 Transcript_59404/m.133882 type:complete len:92 (-) Transcript_59404:235-510(-)